ncbi:unnamed protein product [Prorocentrum cordatum]|uniref:Uncharacterized protein n=1 Tax=Prorocentrum cordatum TaxID=2364126 RepID=A0ABN9RU57_9DINO|nr:unnamed protein product [Polarella glacialis]
MAGDAIGPQSAGLSEEPSSGGLRLGNTLCWEAPNIAGAQLSFERCCLGSEADEDDCFLPLGGWYGRDFCCHEPVEDGCDWDGVLSRMAWADPGNPQTGALREYPVLLREFCCLFPGGEGGGPHACWGADPGVDEGTLPAGFLQCCFPVLQRRLGSPSGDPAWIQAELDREFEPFRGLRWTYLPDPRPGLLRGCRPGGAVGFGEPAVPPEGARGLQGVAL